MFELFSGGLICAGESISNQYCLCHPTHLPVYKSWTPKQAWSDVNRKFVPQIAFHSAALSLLISVAGFFWAFLSAGFIARLRTTLETHDQNPASSSFNEYINIILKTHPFDFIF